MITTRALVHSKFGSLVKHDPGLSTKVMLPEEAVLLGYAVKSEDKKDPNTKVACYKVRNGMARLISAYAGQAPFFTNELEQAPSNWACASTVMPDGAYYSLSGGSYVQHSKGGLVHRAKLPQKNLIHLSQELMRSVSNESTALEIYGLDHSAIDVVDESVCEKKLLRVDKIKSCLFNRFLVGLYGPVPQLSNQFRAVVNNLPRATHQGIKPSLVALYNQVDAYINITKDSSVEDFNKINKPIIRSSNFNFSRQRDKLLKIINFLSIMVGMQDDELIELHKVPSTKDRVPLLNIVECGSPICVSRTDTVNKNFMFPRTWISSPYEENINSQNGWL